MNIQSISKDSGKMFLPLVPISRNLGESDTDEPFPYFEHTLISWITKCRSVSIHANMIIHKNKLQIISYLSN